MQHLDLTVWNWGTTTIWNNIECVAFYFSKSLHPNVHANFSLSKNHRAIIFENTIFLLQRTVAKKNIWNTIFFVAPKMDKFDFDLVKGKTIFFFFLFIFSF